jgi:hypothetical protein
MQNITKYYFIIKDILIIESLFYNTVKLKLGILKNKAFHII